MGKRGPAAKWNTTISLRLRNEHLAALEDALPHTDRSDRIRIAVDWFLRTGVKTYSDLRRKQLRDELAHAEATHDRDLVQKHSVPDDLKPQLERRIEQMKLGVLEGDHVENTLKWLRLKRRPEHEHAGIIAHVEEAMRA